ncbi:hypothetical protein PsorP6_012824 [Peronosclerospora sorghi]|uniref:Uncharacterized protein n=1 Tax=Peronosclerospora sorghi TaxID=230839 RepID=A0ACC0WH57_9STRA|nr:hypothetical protein PsorP6_012824 [Peronosclerospora sorghi]
MRTFSSADADKADTKSPSAVPVKDVHGANELDGMIEEERTFSDVISSWFGKIISSAKKPFQHTKEAFQKQRREEKITHLLARKPKGKVLMAKGIKLSDVQYLGSQERIQEYQAFLNKEKQKVEYLLKTASEKPPAWWNLWGRFRRKMRERVLKRKANDRVLYENHFTVAQVREKLSKKRSEQYKAYLLEQSRKIKNLLGTDESGPIASAKAYANDPKTLQTKTSNAGGDEAKVFRVEQPDDKTGAI